MSKMLVVAMFSLGFAYACGGAQAPGGGGGHAEKGGGQKGASAKGSGQHVGGHATSDKSKGTDRGASYEDVACDDGVEGLAWCDSAAEIAFCSGGEWWILDCTHPDIDGDFCGDN
jgi:hypothetical protein